MNLKTKLILNFFVLLKLKHANWKINCLLELLILISNGFNQDNIVILVEMIKGGLTCDISFKRL